MWTPSRRTLLGRLVTALPAWPLLRPLHGASDEAVRRQAPTLAALAEVVLPTELGAAGVERAVAEFRSWSSGFVARAELDHPYLWSDELRYGPEDPRPGWKAQLERLEGRAERDHGGPFGSLDRETRRRIIEGELEGALPERLGHAGETEHIALALLSWFASTSGANDLCYRAAIGRHQCRGLPSVVDRPAPLEGERR